MTHFRAIFIRETDAEKSDAKRHLAEQGKDRGSSAMRRETDMETAWQCGADTDDTVRWKVSDSVSGRQ